MTERPDLTYETYLALAQQQGLGTDTAHLEGLFLEVQAMFRRIKLLDGVDTSGIQPGSSSNIPNDTASPE